MDGLANLAIAPVSTEKPRSLKAIWDELDPAKQYLIDFRACQGVLFGPDGTVKRLKVHEIAVMFGVTDQTLRDWEKATPNFIELKAWRRKKIFSDKVVDAAWSATGLKAAKGDDAAVERILTNFDPHYKSPKMRHEVDVGENLVELVSLMRQRTQAKVIDGTIVDQGRPGIPSGERPETI